MSRKTVNPLIAIYSIGEREVSGSEFWPWTLGVLTLVLIGRVIADRLDRERIQRELHLAGCEVLDIAWAPFGRGWSGEASSRIYEVRYCTADGREISASCKTGMMPGVYSSAGAPPTHYGDERPEPAEPAVESEPGRSCPRCGSTEGGNARVCSYCGGEL
jgi:hypothetical protein